MAWDLEKDQNPADCAPETGLNSILGASVQADATLDRLDAEEEKQRLAGKEPDWQKKKRDSILR